MLILFRKPGQGIEVRNRVNGDRFDFDFMYRRAPSSFYRINGVECERNETAPFYLDENYEVMVVVVKLEGGARFGIDAPRHFDIRRKEISYA